MIIKSKFLRSFIPFSALVIGAFVGLAQFRKINYTYKPEQTMDIYKEQLKKAGMANDDYQVLVTGSMKDQYEKLTQNVDLDKWENKRGPRPWEKPEEIEERLKREAEERAKLKKR